jgi:hypothetical protein
VVKHDSNRLRGNTKSGTTIYKVTDVIVAVIKTSWTEYACELYRSSDRRLSAKLVPTFADRECRVVNVTDPYGSILGFQEDINLQECEPALPEMILFCGWR